jgi:preprotein translocase subunit YajC
MGTMILAAASKPASKPSDYSFLFIIIILFAAMYFLMIRPQRNRQRQAQQTAREVVPGTKVRTTAGMYGTVISGDNENVIVEFAPGVQIKMMRRAIMNVVPDDEPDGFRQTVPNTGAEDKSGQSGDRGDLSI